MFYRKFKYSFAFAVVSFVVAGFTEYDRLLNFYLIPLKQISMIVQVIPVRTMGPVQTEWTDLTAAAYQDLMEHNAKQVTITDDITKRNCSCKWTKKKTNVHKWL